jgi:hypothetical protein
VSGPTGPTGPAGAGNVALVIAYDILFGL